MRRNLILNIGLSVLSTTITLTNNIAPTFSQTTVENTPNTSTQGKTNNSQSNAVTFMCKEIFDTAGESNIPATIAWVPQRQGHIRLIAWKSEYFSSWSPQKRCQAVTKNFQKYHNEGRLNYLSTGKRNGYPVICAAKPGETCNQNNHLFTIKQGSNPQLVLRQLINITEGKTSGILYQSSGKQLHIEMQKIFDHAPLVKVED